MWDERTIRLLGEKHYSRLKNAKVLVVGCGGVGAMTVEMLSRAGVGYLYIIDSDQYESSNINRQLYATQESLGHDKVEVVKQRVNSINQECEVEGKKVFIDEDNISNLFDHQHFDYVVDAIDTLQPKLALLEYFYHRDIPIISAMGAGGKLDPSKVLVKDISKTFNCMLAKNVRKKLVKRKIYRGIRCVFSSELTDKSKVEETNGDGNKKSIVGTISYMPNLFAIYCSSEVIRNLI